MHSDNDEAKSHPRFSFLSPQILVPDSRRKNCVAVLDNQDPTDLVSSHHGEDSY